MLSLLIASSIYLHHKNYFSITDAIGFLQNYPITAPAMFISLYALLSILLVPTLPLNLAAGMLWGWAWGAVLSLLGVVFGACIAFFMARYIGYDFIRNRLKDKHWHLLWSSIDSYGWKAVAFARINPVFPSAPLNYFFGLTKISCALTKK